MPYITYLSNVHQTNAASSHAGYGRTKEESQAEALYWPNQQPWVRTVAFSRAPQWAIDEARRAYHEPCLACACIHPINERSAGCVDAEGNPLPITRTWPTAVTIFEF